MKLDLLSIEAQDGLRKWANDAQNDELMFDGIDGNPECWAWTWFQLCASPDRPEWFPKGKWATLQRIEELLDAEAAMTWRER